MRLAAELAADSFTFFALPMQVPNLDTIYQLKVNSYSAALGALLPLTR